MREGDSHFPLSITEFFKPPKNRPQFIEETGFEAQKNPLLHVVVTDF